MEIQPQLNHVMHKHCMNDLCCTKINIAMPQAVVSKTSSVLRYDCSLKVTFPEWVIAGCH